MLFVISDDLRTELGCHGVGGIQTPHIDRLASSGVLSSHACVQYPICNPSRTSRLTGRYPTVTGVLDNRTWFGDLHPEFISMPKWFRRHGYVALPAGKIFHGSIDDADAWTEGGEPRQFEGAKDTQPLPQDSEKSGRIMALTDDGESSVDYQAATRTIDYMRRYIDRPFFLACGFSKPHSPPTAPRRFFDMYDAAKIPLPVDY